MNTDKTHLKKLNRTTLLVATLLLVIGLSSGIVSADTEKYDSDFLSMNDIPRNVEPGEEFRADFQMRNTGSRNWVGPEVLKNAPQPFNVHNWMKEDNGEVPSPRVSSNEIHVFRFTATSPQEPGTYVFQFQMFSNRVRGVDDAPIGYFGDKTPKILIEVVDSNSGDVCGNGVIEQGEQCDSNNLDGKTCRSFGYGEGTLECNNCNFDTSNCRDTSNSVCGDGVREKSEQCDNGNNNGACPASCSNSCTLNDCSSSRTGTASGRILDNNGDPVSEVQIRTCGDGTATTNSNGRFSVDVERGFCVRVSLPNGYSPPRAVNSPEDCSATGSYENQVVERNCYRNSNCNNVGPRECDLANDNQFNFRVVKDTSKEENKKTPRPSETDDSPEDLSEKNLPEQKESTLSSPIESQNTVKVSMRGSSFLGNPIAQVHVDGSKIEENEIYHEDFKTYEYQVNKKFKEFAIDFQNDRYMPGVGDRNLFVEWIEVNGERVESNDERVKYDRGRAEKAFDDKDVIAGQTVMWWKGALRFDLTKNKEEDLCGNNICEEGETPRSCPEDCLQSGSQECQVISKTCSSQQEEGSEKCIVDTDCDYPTESSREYILRITDNICKEVSDEYTIK